MFRIVRRVLSAYQAGGKVSRSQRGAVITGYGLKKRDYDIIPAFLFKDADGHVHHVIPNGKQWQVNPTGRDKRLVIELDVQFSRDSERKVLGYRDLVKVLKRLKDALGWQHSHGITSFMIRHAVSLTLEESTSRFNHKQLAAAIGQLQRWLNAGSFPDPYADPQPLSTLLPPLNQNLPGELSDTIIATLSTM